MFPSHPEIDRLVVRQQQRDLAEQVEAYRVPAGSAGRRPVAGLLARLRSWAPAIGRPRRAVRPRPAHSA